MVQTVTGILPSPATVTTTSYAAAVTATACVDPPLPQGPAVGRTRRGLADGAA